MGQSNRYFDKLFLPFKKGMNEFWLAFAENGRLKAPFHL